MFAHLAISRRAKVECIRNGTHFTLYVDMLLHTISPTCVLGASAEAYSTWTIVYHVVAHAYVCGAVRPNTRLGDTFFVGVCVRMLANNISDGSIAATIRRGCRLQANGFFLDFWQLAHLANEHFYRSGYTIVVFCGYFVVK